MSEFGHVCALLSCFRVVSLIGTSHIPPSGAFRIQTAFHALTSFCQCKRDGEGRHEYASVVINNRVLEFEKLTILDNVVFQAVLSPRKASAKSILFWGGGTLPWPRVLFMPTPRLVSTGICAFLCDSFGKKEDRDV